MRKVLATTLLLTLAIAPAQATGQVIYKDQQTAIAKLTVKDESRAGYVRDKFKHWINVGNGCDSRKAVIISEAIKKPTVDKTCKITGGEWLSIYDNVVVTDAGKLDVDHMVPLAEAWDSGASAWTPEKRQMYANDQTDPRHLIAVTGSSNRSKSDQDPADWLPTNKAYICEYLTNWISIKVRWNLSVDKTELAALTNGVKSCKKTKIIVTPVP